MTYDIADPAAYLRAQLGPAERSLVERIEKAKTTYMTSERDDHLAGMIKLLTTNAVIRRDPTRPHAANNPVNRCPTVVVPAEEVERFERQYVSLFGLAKQQGRHFLKVKQELDAPSIKPALGPAEVGARFYRRSDLTGYFEGMLDRNRTTESMR